MFDEVVQNSCVEKNAIEQEDNSILNYPSSRSKSNSQSNSLHIMLRKSTMMLPIFTESNWTKSENCESCTKI